MRNGSPLEDGSKLAAIFPLLDLQLGAILVYVTGNLAHPFKTKEGRIADLLALTLGDGVRIELPAVLFIGTEKRLSTTYKKLVHWRCR